MRLLNTLLLTSISVSGSLIMTFTLKVLQFREGLAVRQLRNRSPNLSTALALVFLCLITNAAHSTSETTGSPITILVLGDSISAAYGLEEHDGWVALLGNELEKTHPNTDIVNASISGETTGGALQRLPVALEKFTPQLMIIELGGNDALRGQSLKQMRSNLTSMVSLAREHGAESLILGMRIPTNYGAIYTERFFQSFATVADESGASLVPFFLEPIATDRAYFQPDGVHPTKDAQPLMLQHVLDPVRTILDSLAERNLRAD